MYESFVAFITDGIAMKLNNYYCYNYPYKMLNKQGIKDEDENFIIF